MRTWYNNCVIRGETLSPYYGLTAPLGDLCSNHTAGTVLVPLGETRYRIYYGLNLGLPGPRSDINSDLAAWVFNADTALYFTTDGLATGSSVAQPGLISPGDRTEAVELFVDGDTAHAIVMWGRATAGVNGYIYAYDFNTSAWTNKGGNISAGSFPLGLTFIRNSNYAPKPIAVFHGLEDS